MSSDLRIVLITGANRGIGLAVCRLGNAGAASFQSGPGLVPNRAELGASPLSWLERVVRQRLVTPAMSNPQPSVFRKRRSSHLPATLRPTIAHQ